MDNILGKIFDQLDRCENNFEEVTKRLVSIESKVEAALEVPPFASGLGGRPGAPARRPSLSEQIRKQGAQGTQGTQGVQTLESQEAQETQGKRNPERNRRMSDRIDVGQGLGMRDELEMHEQVRW